jgi:predicted nucleic acid-binding protein
VTELVADASAIVLTIAAKTERADNLAARLSAAVCHVPHLLDAEVGNALRRSVLAGKITAATAEIGLHELGHFIDERYPHHGALASAAWGLRGAVTYYDALYVALAAGLGIPLLTADARLARAPGLPCTVELIT